MQTSTDIEKIAAALVAAQAELGPALKDSNNPHFKSKYADLGSVWGAVGPVLKKNNLVALQDGVTIDGCVGVRTRIMHASGQWIEFEPVIIPLTKRDAHGVGSAWTYGRRYGLSAALGVVADDDDGAGAVGLTTGGNGAGDAHPITDPTAVKNAPGVSKVKTWVREHIEFLASCDGPEAFIEAIQHERVKWVRCCAVYPNVWSGPDGSGLKGEGKRIATIFQCESDYSAFVVGVETEAKSVQQAAQ